MARAWLLGSEYLVTQTACRAPGLLLMLLAHAIYKELRVSVLNL